jgi:predicted nuclease with TOPRIM domain
MEPATSQTDNARTPGRLLAAILAKLRRLASALLQAVQRDQISEIGEQTRRLGAASVESSTYVNGELRALDERLRRIEQELAALRESLAERPPS